MRFNKITYHNYRCFLDSEIDFSSNKEKNIVLVQAPNGGGKTEIAFSFMWVLYGFNFKDLSGKQDTPYPLNSALYKAMQNGTASARQECSVKLEFVGDDSQTYTVVRTGIFEKKKYSEEILLSVVKENGETEAPIRDADIALQRLGRVIPKDILVGLIFDGERMQQMNNSDAAARKAVEGVIKHVTNEALFELCKGQLETLKEDNSKMLRTIEKSLNKKGQNSIEDDISDLEAKLETNEITLAAKKETEADLTLQIDQLHDELEKHQDSKKYEEIRKKAKDELAIAEKKLKEAIDTFYKDLDKGYLLITDKLIEDTRNSLEHIDVPFGLTTEAVKSILKRDTCICGHPLDEESRKTLETLLCSLPPDNISSTISEMTHTVEASKEGAAVLIKRSHDVISGIEEDIAKLRNIIAENSAMITANASETIRDLESKKSEAERKLHILQHEMGELDEQITKDKAELVKLKQIRLTRTGLDTDYKHMSQRISYIEKCLHAIKAIDRCNKVDSLISINKKLNAAYSQLSPDYKLGRRLHIGQYEGPRQYSMVSYKEQTFMDLRRLREEDGSIRSWNQLGKSDSEIDELIILEDKISGSTGQNKANSLAFAKAILDYSNEKRDLDNIVEISRSYPFLIDSPFTELDADYLKMTAENIHNFSDQIILLVSPRSIDGVEDYILPYVSKYYEIVKIDNEHTQINSLED